MTLARIIQELQSILNRICEYLKSLDFEIIFCAADGIACKGSVLDVNDFTHYIKNIGKPNYTFSAGIGNDLQASFFALKYAKAIGKDTVVTYEAEAKFRIINS